MKKILTLLLTLAIALSGTLYAYDREDALKDWVDADTCNARCEKAEDCINRKGDDGSNGRTACSEKCIDICDTIGEEKGEFD
jgi:uncharacterized protein YxeA